MRNIIWGILGLSAVLAVGIELLGFAGSADLPEYGSRAILDTGGSSSSHEMLMSKANPIARALPSSLDLTGVYIAKPVGTYYIKQTGNNICWYGEDNSKNPSWSNIAYGTINGNTITLNWVDVPKGNTQNRGTLTLSVIQSNGLIVLNVEAQTGGAATYQLISAAPGSGSAVLGR